MIHQIWYSERHRTFLIQYSSPKYLKIEFNIEGKTPEKYINALCSFLKKLCAIKVVKKLDKWNVLDNIFIINIKFPKFENRTFSDGSGDKKKVCI